MCQHSTSCYKPPNKVIHSAQTDKKLSNVEYCMHVFDYTSIIAYFYFILFIMYFIILYLYGFFFCLRKFTYISIGDSPMIVMPYD